MQVSGVSAVRLWVCLKQHCAFSVDSEGKTIVGRIIDSGPTQVLRYAPRIAPPIRQAKLYTQISTPRFSYHFVEVYERLFIPVSGEQAKRMCARPISEIGHGFHVVWSAFSKSPHSHHLYSRRAGLPERLSHSFAIFIPIHHSKVCTNEPERTTLELETAP